MIIDNLPTVARIKNHPIYKNEIRYCYVEPEKYVLVGETFERNWEFEVNSNRVSVFFTEEELISFRPDYSNTKYCRETDRVLVTVYFE